MCFWKSKQSKVLRAKRDIVVYKIGTPESFLNSLLKEYIYK